MSYFNLGDYSKPATTTSPNAQIWFTRGLIWTYAYHHEEGIVCFQNAIATDADCALAHWGIAYAIGPNYNKPWEGFEEDEIRGIGHRACISQTRGGSEGGCYGA